ARVSAVAGDPRPRVTRSVKRALDVALAAILLVALSPLLAVAIVAIRLESRGAAIYRQRRVGKHGVEFDLLKLRTMVAGAEPMRACLAVDEGEPRVPRVEEE